MGTLVLEEFKDRTRVSETLHLINSSLLQWILVLSDRAQQRQRRFQDSPPLLRWVNSTILLLTQTKKMASSACQPGKAHLMLLWSPILNEVSPLSRVIRHLREKEEAPSSIQRIRKMSQFHQNQYGLNTQVLPQRRRFFKRGFTSSKNQRRTIRQAWKKTNWSNSKRKRERQRRRRWSLKSQQQVEAWTWLWSACSLSSNKPSRQQSLVKTWWTLSKHK